MIIRNITDFLNETLDRCNRLNLNPRYTYLFGSAPAYIFGYTTNPPNDFDFIVPQVVWTDLARRIRPVKSTTLGTLTIKAGPDVEIFNKTGFEPKITVTEMIKKSIIVRGVTLVDIGCMVRWWSLSARKKDLEKVAMVLKGKKGVK